MWEKTAPCPTHGIALVFLWTTFICHLWSRYIFSLGDLQKVTWDHLRSKTVFANNSWLKRWRRERGLVACLVTTPRLTGSMTLTWGRIDFIFQHHRVYVSTHLDRETLWRPNYVASFSRSKVVCGKPFLPKKVTLKFGDRGWLNRRCRLKTTRSWIEDRFRTIYCLFPFPASSQSAKDWGQNLES